MSKNALVKKMIKATTRAKMSEALAGLDSTRNLPTCCHITYNYCQP